MHLKDMNNAVERTYKCIKKNELISIFGDYDVDGASSTALLVRYFLNIKQKTKTCKSKSIFHPSNSLV